MYKAFLVKYGEIGLKGSNRHIFENALRDRVQEKLGVLQSAWYFFFWAYRATMRRL